ncbi:MAG: ABC transporter ATP-binding protein [Victivallaceae bacterium]|nr:ABC transporter ATP-binding protein [Victivallaceae bacterium]
MIELSNISFRYGKKSILESIDLSVPQGEFLCLLGQSGCGKSTLLRLIAGLAKPSSGNIKNENESNRCAVVFQDYSLFPWMTTGENLLLALRATWPEKKTAVLRDIAQKYLELVGLPHCFQQYPAALSGGMRQRAAIARALSVDPEILLMDEPFGALDVLNRAMLQDLLLELFRASSRRRTVVFVTHDVDEAIYLGNRIVVLGSTPGRVIADNHLAKTKPRLRDELFRLPQTRELQNELLDVYRRDTWQKLPATKREANGGGI